MPIHEQHEPLNRHSRALLLTLVWAAVFVIGWIRYWTGPEFALSFLYLLPIVAATWLLGGTWGILVSVVSALTWLAADLAMLDRFSHAYIPLINECLRLVVFLFIVLVITRYRKILNIQQELAMLDPLTGVMNRRAFYQLATVEIDRSRRYDHPFSVMVIDIDDFKQINDNCGHHTGDRLLVEVVHTIKHHLRAIDIVSRFGGDEFVVLLVKTGETAAAVVARKLRQQLLDVMHNKQWRVTFSIGLATYLSVPKSVEETIRAADELMYQVKHHGKDDIRQAVINT